MSPRSVVIVAWYRRAGSMTCSAWLYRFGISRIVRGGADWSSCDARRSGESFAVGVVLGMDQELVALGWDDRELPLHSYVACYYLDERTLRRSLAFLRLGL